MRAILLALALVDGSGKLGAGSGTRAWRGMAGSGSCAGTWTAEKR
jgi:hypothetical protein